MGGRNRRKLSLEDAEGLQRQETLLKGRRQEVTAGIYLPHAPHSLSFPPHLSLSSCSLSISKQKSDGLGSDDALRALASSGRCQGREKNKERVCSFLTSTHKSGAHLCNNVPVTTQDSHRAPHSRSWADSLTVLCALGGEMNVLLLVRRDILFLS